MPSISEILANEDFGQVVSTLCVDTIEYREPREYYREYHGERRRRKTSVGWREPKRLAVYSETLKDKNGDRYDWKTRLSMWHVSLPTSRKRWCVPLSPSCLAGK